MKPLRRKHAVSASAPPVAVPDVLPLYQALFPELGVSPDVPTVQLHAASCGAAVSHARGSWPPGLCTCPNGSGYPRTVATVADGDEPIDAAMSERNRSLGLT